MDNTIIPKGSFTKRDIASLAFKRKNLILSFFLLTTALVAAGSYVMSRQYEVVSRVFVKRNVAPIPQVSADSSILMALERTEYLLSEVAVLTSRAVIGETVDILLARGTRPEAEEGPKQLAFIERLKEWKNQAKEDLIAFLQSLGLLDEASEREGMITEITNKLEVEPVEDTDVLEIIYKSTKPRFATELVNIITKVYLERSLSLSKRGGGLQFYTDQIEQSKAELRGLEEKLDKFKKKSSIVSIDEEVRLKLAELSDLRLTLWRTSGEKIEMEKKIGILREQLLGQPQEVTSSKRIKRDPTIEKLNGLLFDLETEKAKLLEKFTPQSKPIKNLDKRIEDTRLKLAQQPLTAIDEETVSTNAIRDDLALTLHRAESDYAAKAAREAITSRQIRELEAELGRLDQQTTEIKALSRAISAAEKTYLEYTGQFEEARRVAAMDPQIANVRVVHFAAVPERPKYSRLLLILVGAIAGLLLGFGFAVVAEYFDHSLDNWEDVRNHLDLPVLALIPETRFNDQSLVGNPAVKAT